jgi:hypothetical protein
MEGRAGRSEGTGRPRLCHDAAGRVPVIRHNVPLVGTFDAATNFLFCGGRVAT